MRSQHCPSTFGSLLFLININDVVYSVDKHSCLFTDDTTLSVSGDNLAYTFVDFSKKLTPLLYWVKFNKLTINWSKTKLMFISKQRSARPSYLIIDGFNVELVDVERLKASVNQKIKHYQLKNYSISLSISKFNF